MRFIIGIILLVFFAGCVPKKIIDQHFVENKTLIPYHPLNNENDLDILLKEIDTAKIVLLGEASHGTSEYYLWRAAISKKLISEKGFNVIAVEGDWTDCYKVNNFIKSKSDTTAVVSVLKQFNRWPTWLWANEETASFVTWLKAYNTSRENKVSFYGLDLFNIEEAADEILPLLNPKDTTPIKTVKRFQNCFGPFANDEHQYTRSLRGTQGCKEAAASLWQIIHQIVFRKKEPSENDFVMEQNALVAFDGELYLRSGNAVDAWNLRDNHMLETVTRLLKFNPNSKIIIWAHNNHVGDAQYTTMHWSGKTNLGNLLRYKYGQKNVYIIGTGTYSGTVVASEKWGTTWQQMEIAKADDSSWEQKLHEPGKNKLIISGELMDKPLLLRWISNVGIGVIYHPLERTGIYSISVMPKRYDSYLFFDHTNALHPIETPAKGTISPSKVHTDL